MIPGGSRPALARLLGPELDRLPDAWGRDALLASVGARAAGDFADLFSAEAVDELLAGRGLRAPFLRIARDGSTLPDSAFTSGGGVGAAVGDQVDEDKVRRLFASGATVVLQGLHRTWTPIREFAAELAAELGHPVQVNAYVTPAQSQGFSPHYDVHDVFILQIAGAKRWLLHDPVVRAPLRAQTWATAADAVAARAAEPPALEVDLSPGDVLYLPRGHIHSARALGGLTIHLTIGVHVWTRHHVAEALLDGVRSVLAADPAVREALPLGVDVGDPGQLLAAGDAVRGAISTALAGLDAEALASALLGHARASQRPAALGPLAQVAAAVSVTPEALLRLRSFTLPTVEPDGDRLLVVRSRAGRCSVAAEHRDALDRLLGGGSVPAGDFGEYAAVLLAEGIAVPA